MQNYAAKSLCHKIRSKIYYPKIWMQNMPQKFTPLKLDAKNLAKYYAAKICISKFNAKT